MVTPTFEQIGSETYDIVGFSVNGVEDMMATVQAVNTDGSWGQMAFWFNAFDEYPAGWFDESGEVPAEISLKPGQAVWFYTQSEKASVQSAGQVADTTTITLDKGYSMIGNSSPVTLDIDAITLDGVDDMMATVQIVNPDGSWGKMAFWFNAYDEYPAGWFDESGETAAEIVLEPGQSVWFYTQSEKAVATVPGALSK